ncbi:MAG: DUF167 domain-containing protein [Candidatus Altiarchaeota archaeon]|nr:DUF167 domain-containing protein [Candidatus Altiarchaeota archaeon]
MLECVRSGTDCVYIDVHVVPWSKKVGLSYDPYGKRLRVKTPARAMEGAANKSVAGVFAGFFGNCEVFSGLKSRKKTLLIGGVSCEVVSAFLEDLLKE